VRRVRCPGWVWLLPLALLLALYPLGSWGDAPLFPTPGDALDGLADRAPLPAGAAVVDAGCGLGAGLIALHRQYPQAQIHGLEWSWPLALLCRLRCRFARQCAAPTSGPQTGRATGWSICSSGPRACRARWTKRAAELAPGAWLVSLEFEADGLAAAGPAGNGPGKPVWLYRAPFTRR
jgi:hypothetical protein